MPKLDFAGQRADEKLLFVFRRHIIAVRKGFYGLLIALVLGSIPFLIWQNNINLLWGLVIGLAVGIAVFLYHWVGWYFSVFIVTNTRIRQVSQKSLFGRSVIDLNLNKIQNYSYQIPGFFGETFGFGTIVLQTMVGDMIIGRVKNCENVYQKLVAAVDAAGGGRAADDIDKTGGQNEQGK